MHDIIRFSSKTNWRVDVDYNSKKYDIRKKKKKKKRKKEISKETILDTLNESCRSAWMKYVCCVVSSHYYCHDDSFDVVYQRQGIDVRTIKRRKKRKKEKKKKRKRKSYYDGLVRGNVRNGLKPVLPRIMNGLPPPYRTITWLVTSGFIAGIRDTYARNQS